MMTDQLTPADIALTRQEIQGVIDATGRKTPCADRILRLLAAYEALRAERSNFVERAWFDEADARATTAEAALASAEARVKTLEAAACRDVQQNLKVTFTNQALVARVAVLRDALKKINTLGSCAHAWDAPCVVCSAVLTLSTLDSSADRLAGELEALRYLAAELSTPKITRVLEGLRHGGLKNVFDALAAWRKLKEGTWPR